MSAGDDHLTPRNSMVINRAREPRYWRETEDAHGHWVSTGQPGPPVTVVVAPNGVRVHGDVTGLKPSAARWLACRLLEACGVYETTFGGDGSTPRDGGRAREIALVPDGGTGAKSTPGVRATKWICGCGKESTNKGAMAVHENTCPNGPATAIEVELDA